MDNGTINNNPSQEQKTMKTHYIVQTAQASMPASCWGKYGRVAVLEVDIECIVVSRISENARGVHRIVETWERRFWGTSDRCAFSRAYDEALALVEKLNNKGRRR